MDCVEHVVLSGNIKGINITHSKINEFRKEQIENTNNESEIFDEMFQ